MVRLNIWKALTLVLWAARLALCASTVRIPSSQMSILTSEVCQYCQLLPTLFIKRNLHWMLKLKFCRSTSRCSTSNTHYRSWIRWWYVAYYVSDTSMAMADISIPQGSWFWCWWDNMYTFSMHLFSTWNCLGAMENWVDIFLSFFDLLFTLWTLGFDYWQDYCAAIGSQAGRHGCEETRSHCSIPWSRTYVRLGSS